MTHLLSLGRFQKALLAAGLSAQLAVAQPTIRILPLGDSITYGFGTQGGYRGPLHALLTNAGYAVDYVGTQGGNPAPGLADINHEGHNGWRVDQIDAVLQDVFTRIPSPDIILLLIGTNDFGQGYQIETAINRLDALIAKLALDRPAARIVVANLLVRGEPHNSNIQSMFNPYVAGIVAKHAALGRLVSFTDMRSAVPLADLPDSLHPNVSGYAKMATNWFQCITNAFPLEPGTPVALLSTGSMARYVVPTNNSFGQSWTGASSFDDGSWMSGPGAIGYQVPLSMYSNLIQSFVPPETWDVYARWPFTVADDKVYDSLTLRMRIDDGFVAYLNGVRVAQTNAPDAPTFDAHATAPRFGPTALVPLSFNLHGREDLLHVGTNIMAIHALNHAIAGPVVGMLIAPELDATEHAPAVVDVPQSAPGRGAILDVRASTGTTWRLDASADLIQWDPLATFAMRLGFRRHTDSVAPRPDRRFYLLVHLPGTNTVTGDHIATSGANVLIHPVYHASFALLWGERTVYVDPSTNSFAGLPRADVLLFTHAHGDHFNAAAVPGLLASNAVVVAPTSAYTNLSAPMQALTAVLTNGAGTTVGGIAIEAVPMYNTGASPPHAPGIGNGYVLTLGGKRFYVSGDSSDTPEMRALTGIDVAFINLLAPWMTPASAAAAIRAFAPKVVYPCHTWGTDLDLCRQAIGTDLPIEVRIRQWH